MVVIRLGQEFGTLLDQTGLPEVQAIERLEPFTGIYEVPDAARMLRVTMPVSDLFPGTVTVHGV